MGITTNGLVLYLPLYSTDLQGSPITSKDASQTSCTVTGATWGSQGRTFDGTDDDVRMTSPTFATNETGTMIWWEKSSVLGGYSPCFSDVAGIGVDEFRLIHNANGSFDLDVIDNGVNDVIRTDNTGLFSTSRFSFVAIVSSGTAWSIYHGTPTAAPTLQPVTLITGGNNGDWFGDLSTAQTFAVGGLVRATLVADWAGVAGEVWIYNRALTLAEITDNYKETIKTYAACWGFATWK